MKHKIPDEFRVLSPTAILGYGFPEESFAYGMKRKPHLIGVDAGSTDPGPYYLGAGKSFTNRDAVKRDLGIMIAAGVRAGIPVVIGSAGGSGARPHVLWCKKIIEEIACERRLSFKLGVVFADIPKETVLAALKKNKIVPLPFVPELTPQAVKESTDIVAQMGIEPIVRALGKGCQVVLAGRCYDPAVFAALPVSLGFDPGLAVHMGKILECAAIAASPGSGADCVLGTLRRESFILESCSPARRFTKLSTSAHTLYEKSDPYHLPGPGGAIDLTRCSFTEHSNGTCEVRGSVFIPTDTYYVKLEAARRAGYRAVSIAGVRDPVMIRGIDAILDGVRNQLSTSFAKQKIKGEIYFHVYGKNGVMGIKEPLQGTAAHELGIVIDAVGETMHEAETICSVTRSTLLHYGYPGRISTAGNLAFPFSPSDIPMGEVYEFSMYHLMQIDDQGIFKLKVYEFGRNKKRNNP